MLECRLLNYAIQCVELHVKVIYSIFKLLKLNLMILFFSKD